MISRISHAFARRRPTGDDGIALLMALIFVMTIGLVTAALLPYTSAGIKTSEAVRDVRTTQNAVDGAMDEAINSVRGGLVLGSKTCSSSGSSDGQYDALAYPNQLV